jgi:hypothetical protein
MTKRITTKRKLAGSMKIVALFATAPISTEKEKSAAAEAENDSDITNI